MFVDSMSSNELLHEYQSDLKELRLLTMRFDNSDYIRRYLWKRRKQSKVVVCLEFKTSRNSRYLGLLFYSQSGTGKNKVWDMSATHLGLMTTYKGICTIAFYAESNRAMKITPHFFQRYKERFLPQADWQTRARLKSAKSISDIIAVFVERNIGMTWIETKSVFGKKAHIFAPVNDGVALLEWDKDKKLLQANTFITMDMLDAKQKEMVEYAMIYLELPKHQREKFRFPDFVYDESS